MDGETVLVEAAASYRKALGERLIAAYALGSLAHGGFSPLVSDIDLGLIVSDPARPRDAKTIRAIAGREKAKGSPLHERISVFWGTPATLRGESDGGRFPPLDRLDLIESGRPLFGSDEVRASLPRPSADELLITGAQFALEYLAGVRADMTVHNELGSMRRAGDDAVEEILSPETLRARGVRRVTKLVLFPVRFAHNELGSMRRVGDGAVEEILSPERLLARGVRRVTKLVLFPVRFLFTADTGEVGTNDAAVAYYLRDERAPSKPLVVAALEWRTAPSAEEAAAELLRKHMVPLYVHFIDDHVRRLSSLGEAELVAAFRAWRHRLVG